ncbi:MAG: phosphotransferase [Euryarchaeota archaeon]|nr:phosphotransferase [Euryarchaeota archaeon]
MKGVIKREIRKINPSKLGLRSMTVESFSELGVGEGNMNYLCKINNKKFICRVNIDRKMPSKARDEYRALKAVEHLGIAPKAFYLHKASTTCLFDFIILEYIEGKAFRMKKRTYLKEQIKEMAKILAGLHNIKDDKLARSNYSYKHYLDGGLAYIELINKRTNMGFESELKNLHNKIKGRIPLREAHEFGLIHGDICPQNIIETRNGLRLIDWESLQFSDPARDIANIIIDMGLKDKNLELFFDRIR